MTGDAFRAIALDMPGALEASHMGHPDFRAGGRIFCSLTADEARATVKLTPDEQQEFLRMHAKVFTPASGAWGRQGWTTIALAAADRAAVRGAVALAWQHVADQPSRRRRAARGQQRGRR
jgi:hypothetical protein